MLVDDIGDVTITNDGATILKQLEVQHPAGKVLVELSQLQDSEVLQCLQLSVDSYGIPFQCSDFGVTLAASRDNRHWFVFYSSLHCIDTASYSIRIVCGSEAQLLSLSLMFWS
jgi:hypothetical protein